MRVINSQIKVLKIINSGIWWNPPAIMRNTCILQIVEIYPTLIMQHEYYVSVKSFRVYSGKCNCLFFFSYYITAILQGRKSGKRTSTGPAHPPWTSKPPQRQGGSLGGRESRPTIIHTYVCVSSFVSCSTHWNWFSRFRFKLKCLS